MLGYLEVDVVGSSDRLEVGALIARRFSRRRAGGRFDEKCDHKQSGARLFEDYKPNLCPGGQYRA